MNIVAHLVIGQNSSIDYWSLKFYADYTGYIKWYAGLLIDEFSFVWELRETSEKDSSLIMINSENDTSHCIYYFKDDSLCMKESYKFYCFIAD